MLYYLKGADFGKVRDRVRVLVANLLAKKPNASYFSVSDENVSSELMEELIGSQGLFERKYVVFADCLFSRFGELLEDKICKMGESENIFIVAEDLPPRNLDEKLSACADKIEEIKSKSAAGEKEPFNVFSLSEALAARDKKKLWVLYNKARISGLSAEEILPTLFWQTKTLLSVKLSENPEELGLKPFVLGKAKRACQKWKTEELRNLLSRFVSIYHETRLGLVDFEAETEKTILEM